jgi:hypothetical protein
MNIKKNTRVYRKISSSIAFTIPYDVSASMWGEHHGDITSTRFCLTKQFATITMYDYLNLRCAVNEWNI